ncbi:hypothetical protein Bca101_024629 [Brassica carinata]
MGLRISNFIVSNYDETKEERIVYIPKEADDKILGVTDLTHDILLGLEYAGPGHYNAAVIAKPTEELRRILGCMKSRDHNVVLIEPPPYEECRLSR